MPAPYRGRCQCGAVRYEIADEPASYYVCHCTDCQIQSGSAFGMSLRIDGRGFRLVAGELKTIAAQADSDRTKYGAFCPACGTRIYHSLGSLSPWFNVKSGTLDAPLPFAPVAHLWTSRKQPWVTIPDGVAHFAQQPPEMDTLERLWADRNRKG